MIKTNKTVMKEQTKINIMILLCIIMITIVLTLVATYSKAGDTTTVKLDHKEFLFVELPGDDGSTIYRNYKTDGYIDLIITKDYHVNGKIHFYQPDKIQDFQVAFVSGDKEPQDKDFIMKVSNQYNVKSELETGEVYFGIMNKEKFLSLSEKYKDFTLILVYKKDGKIEGNDITIGQE